MKNAVLAFAILAVSVVCAGFAQAQSSRLYFAGYMGLNTHSGNSFSESLSGNAGSLEIKNAFSMAGALGLRLTPQWRIEGEISRRGATVSHANVNGVPGSVDFSGEFRTWLYLANLYYDIDWSWKNIQPFLSAGLGFASHDAELSGRAGLLPGGADNSLGFAWQLGGGLKYRVNPNFAITSNYRYVGTTDAEVDSYDVKYTNHEFRLGLEYDLPMDWFH